jgi:hypothetical protein
MPELIAFRPRMGVEKLKTLSKKMDYPNVSRFIEDAILEKVHREVHLKKNPEVQKLSEDIGKLIMKYLGVRWAKPDSKLEKEIRNEAEGMRSGKVKSHQWKGSLKQLFDDTEHHHYSPPSKNNP